MDKIESESNHITELKLYSVICRSKIAYGCQPYTMASPWKTKKIQQHTQGRYVNIHKNTISDSTANDL